MSQKNNTISKLPNLPKHYRPQAFARICNNIEVTLIKPISTMLSFDIEFSIPIALGSFDALTWQLDEMHRQFPSGR